jgi:hypothetical protein
MSAWVQHIKKIQAETFISLELLSMIILIGILMEFLLQIVEKK